MFKPVLNSVMKSIFFMLMLCFDRVVTEIQKVFKHIFFNKIERKFLISDLLSDYFANTRLNFHL